MEYYSLEDKITIAKEILETSIKTFEEKTNDYGVTTYDRIRSIAGPSYVNNRILEKTLRVKTLTESDTKRKVEESIEDSYRDIIGYCLCELVYKSKK